MKKTEKTTLAYSDRAQSAPVSQSLTYRLHKLHKITDAQSQHAYLKNIGLSLSNSRCLVAIGSFDGISVKELARQTNLNESRASRGAQALVDQGLVIKKNSDQDGRGVVLELTSEGLKIWERAMKVIETRNQQIFDCLKDEEKKMFSEILDRLINHNETFNP